MATITGEEFLHSSTAANSPSVSDARLMVATSQGDCQKLKNLVNQQDAATMVLVVASSNPRSEKVPFESNMHPLLLAAACKGNLDELKFLLNREGQLSQSITPSGLELLLHKQVQAYTKMQLATVDVEEGTDMKVPSVASLLKGITVHGDTALHVVATSGDDENYLECATFIYAKAESFISLQNNSEEVSFLFKQNINYDTPLHLAARAGNKKMVIHLIGRAKGKNNDMDRVKRLLRMENQSEETALHDAVRVGDNDLVKELLKNDPELARFPIKGSSPLYLAILLGQSNTARTLHDEDNDLSYLGPKGQNALHAAVHRGPALPKILLKWRKELAAGSDENGSTPLHFAAQLGRFLKFLPGIVCRQILIANTAALYQPDHQGSFPIHVAASTGSRGNVAMFIRMLPSSAGLRDAKGRTFLHVAVKKHRNFIVSYACGNRSLAWILNMQDNDGNTALHLAVQASRLKLFCPLFGNQQVNLNLTNKVGQTPMDVARYKIRPEGMYSPQNSEVCIRSALSMVGAMNGVTREDHFQENYEDTFCKPKSDYERKQRETLKEVAQSLCIGSVLIATVTFGTTFQLPGGYNADDSDKKGTPALAGRYAFHAFMMANTLAFVFSSSATVGLVRSGNPLLTLASRVNYAGTAFYFMQLSLTCLIAAFSLGVYAMLGPVARKTAIAICVLSPLAVVCNHADHWVRLALLAGPLYRRKGLVWSVVHYPYIFGGAMFVSFWPFMIIFLWAAFGGEQSGVSS